MINKTISTHEYLTNIKNEMKREITTRGNTINLEESKRNAKKLEYFFNSIGGMQLDKNNLIEGVAFKEIQDAVEKLHLGSKWLFKNNNTNTGTVFEDYFNALNNRIMENAKQQGIVNWSKSYNYIVKTGTSTVDIYKNVTDNLLDEVTKNLINSAYKNIQDELDKQEKEAEKKLRINAKVQGKIDSAMKKIDFQVSTSNKFLEDVLKLLSNASFTDKAYATTSDVRIGQTNSFRVFMAASGEGSAKDKLYQWYRMLGCMTDHQNHEAALLFYQIRWMYELTGYGLEYTNNKITQALGKLGADYFIYYHPGSGVKVLSTAVIVNDFLRAVEDDNLLKYKIKDIDKQYALYAKLKMRIKNDGQFEFGE